MNNKPVFYSILVSFMLLGCGEDNSSNTAAVDDSTSIETQPDKPIPLTCSAEEKNKVLIRYTDYGVPHITACSEFGMAYGQAYAHAQENLCTLSKSIVSVRSELAAYFGPGENNTHIDEDFGVLALGVYQKAQDTFDGLSEEHQAVLSGYVAGFNFALEEKTDFPSECKDADWVKPMSALDLHAYHLRLALLSSGDAVVKDIGKAQPLESEQQDSQSLNKKIMQANISIGSNGWAIGRDRSETGKGMLLSNPHFPWYGHLRFVQSHVTIPGKLDVTGVGFMGVPGILIGFNEHLGWTHTVSQSKRMTLYNLKLDDQNKLSKTTYKIDVKQPDGTLKEIERTLHFTQYGPVMNFTGPNSVLTFRDANRDNINIVPQWLAMNKAKNLLEFEQAFIDHQGVPWVNTIATDVAGEVFYIDAARTAYLDKTLDSSLKQLLNTPIGLLPNSVAPTAKLLQSYWQGGKGQLVLDGNDPSHQWQTSQSIQPGTVPFESAPKLKRTDYVFNANSSHWLTNLDEPLTGFSIVYGPEQTTRSPRTRMNAIELTEKNEQGASGSDGLFNFEELKRVMTNQRGLLAELIKNQVVDRCRLKQTVVVDNQDVDISLLCEVLDKWDGRYTTQSVGAHVFRTFLLYFKNNEEKVLNDELFAQGFKTTDPILTPSGLVALNADIDQDIVLLALAKAKQALDENQFPLMVSLGELQFHQKGEKRFSIPGGRAEEGVFNINTGPTVAGVGYPIAHGASWVMALEYTEAGPQAEGWLTYSQSHDPESIHYDDQTELYSEGIWRPILFNEQAIQDNVKHYQWLTLPLQE